MIEIGWPVAQLFDFVACNEPISDTRKIGVEKAAAALMPLRIVVVDDHEMVRRGLRDLFDAEDGLQVVGEAGSVAEARHLFPAAAAEVAVLDVRLPDGSGIELCRELRSADPSLRCLMLTSFDHDEALLSAIVAGASGYLLKDVKGIDIVDAVREIGRGRSLLSATLKAGAVERLRHRAAGDSTLAGLSRQEHRLLELLVEGKTNRQIGADMSLTEKTVKNYVSSLLTKMGMSRRTEAAVYAARETERSHLTEH